MDDSLFRSPGPPDGPRRSLVIISRAGAPDLEDALDAWAGAIRRGLDLVVVRCCTSAERLRLERAHPGVRVLSAPADRDLRALRELGVSAARGDIVIVQEDSPADGGLPSGRDQAIPRAVDSAEWSSRDRTIADLESRR